jgi:hypothetical protein
MSTTIDKRAVSDVRDFLASIPQAWTPFSKKLAAVLSKLEMDQYLIISAKDSNRFVQFANEGEAGTRVEVTSNHFLRGRDRLNRRQISWLRSSGWSAPTGDVNEATPEKDPNGSPNYFVDLSVSVAASDIARLAIAALVHVWGIPNPASLVYEAFGPNGRTLQFDQLGLKPAPLQGRRLTEKVLEVFRQVTGIADLELDKDGDVLIFRGGIPIWTTPVENKMRLCSAIPGEVIETPAILRRLNKLNKEAHGLRCVIHDETIYTLFDILANPFIPEHFMTAIDEFSENAIRIATLLRDELSCEASTEASAAPTYIQ